ncbi:hypothetical protein ACHAXN_011506 [Cyclotella atomus]
MLFLTLAFALIDLRQVGVFAGALIKKRRYWPAWIAGDAIDEHMSAMQVGGVASVAGSLSGVKYNVWCMKDQGYVAKIMGTASGLIYNNDRERTRVVDDGSTVRFKYIEPFDLHYKFRHAVDDHNNLRHAVPSIEGTWRTTRWAMRQFQFYLAVAEVNMYLAYRHWVWTDDGEEMPLLAFRRMLGWSMIRNELWNFQPQGLGRSLRGRQPLAVHVKQRCPPFTSHWDGNGWDTSATFAYNQFTCGKRGCKKRIRTYCCCNPTKWLCDVHWTEHFHESVIQMERDD